LQYQSRLKKELNHPLPQVVSHKTIMETLLRDIRYGVRSLLKRPAFTAIAVITLALGIGANTAIFSVVNAVLLRPLPYDHPEQLVALAESERPNDLTKRFQVAPANFLDWRAQNHSFAALGAADTSSFNLTGTDRPERVVGAVASASVFSILGIHPIAGRAIIDDDDRPEAQRVVLLSESLWQRRYGRNAQLVGQPVALNGEPYIVVGVMPAGFRFPEADVDLWVPIERQITPKDMHWRGSHYLTVIGRLKPGVKLEQARAEMNQLTAAIKNAQHGDMAGGAAIVLSLQNEISREIRPALFVLLGAVGLVLLIACANVASLLLARANSRLREITIRVVLGASRRRIARQLVTESVLLSLTGGGIGLVLGEWIRSALLALSPDTLPRVTDIHTDGWVLMFALLMSLLTGMVFGLAPVLHSMKTDLNSALRGGSHQSSRGIRGLRLQRLIVTAEIAMSLVLLIAGGLLLKSFMKLSHADAGYRASDVVTTRVTLPRDRYQKYTERTAFFERALSSVGDLPGVELAGASSFVPLTGKDFDNSFSIEGRPVVPGKQTYALFRVVDANYFQIMEIPLLRGRGFTDHDRADTPPVVIISESMARIYWANEDALGKRLKIDIGENPVLREVVGILRDVHYTVTEEAEPTMYAPYRQLPNLSMVIVAKTKAAPETMLSAIGEAVRKVDPDQPVQRVRTMDQIRAESVVPWRFSMLLIGSFALLALVLASVGIYGVMSYAVTERTQEIGIRMALGAQTADVLKLVVRNGLGLALVGVAFGLAGAFALTRLMTSLLFGVAPTDATTFAAVSLGLIAVVLLACFIPARRATKVDPLVALRYE